MRESTKRLRRSERWLAVLFCSAIGHGVVVIVLAALRHYIG